MGKYRTRPQLEADRLDLYLFNLSRGLEEFATLTGDAKLDDASRIVFGLRNRLAKHRHPEDVAGDATTPSAQESGR